MASEVLSESKIQQILESVSNWFAFEAQYIDPRNVCFREYVNFIYKGKIMTYNVLNPFDQISSFNLIKLARVNWNIANLDKADTDAIYIRAPFWVHNNDLKNAKEMLNKCLHQRSAKEKKEAASIPSNNLTSLDPTIGDVFDSRLGRMWKSASDKEKLVIPFSSSYAQTATGGYFSNANSLTEFASNVPDVEKGKIAAKNSLNLMQKDSFYTGVVSLQNTYAVTKLYGSEGGKLLVNKHNSRRWYEVDQAIGENNMSQPGYSSVPTTSSLISWGMGDPYGRTPYHFTDFAFCKHWNKIENNRLITLRRFGAPILDNMKFPGMDGKKTIGSNGQSGGKILFPPMASAVTYFGEETGNDLSSLIKFTTGLNWGEVQSNVWEVTSASVPDNEAGPGKMFGGLATMGKMLNIGAGNVDYKLLMNDGNLPPDPYKDGPYENRILGPVNRIDKVKKREAGLVFEWSGLELVFEYSARPIGGINSKAVLLDIMSNFLVIGSASAVFFGGQHRFMSNPAKYPFLGGDKGIDSWYGGHPLEWAKSTLTSFVDSGKTVIDKLSSLFSSIMNSFSNGGGIGGLVDTLAGSSIVQSGVKTYLAEKTSGQIPYLSGMKALLTGEPVGDWHVTIGNPLNPIAMIGNLICTGVEVEFGKELGPDDFPTTVKFKVKLDHGMPRDKDSIQSVFNRGMGRIYDLPDMFLGTADGLTRVDKYTADFNSTGTPSSITGSGIPASSGTSGGNAGKSQISSLPNTGSNSVYTGGVKFQAVSPNSSIINDSNEMMRSSYRAVDWVALKSLK